MDEPQLRILEDGEIEGGIPHEWGDKPKKKGAARWRLLRRVLKGFLIVVPIVLLTIFLTLNATGYIKWNDFEWYRRLCIATLGPNRVSFGAVDASAITTSSIKFLDLDNGKQCMAANQGARTEWSPDGKQLLISYMGQSELHLMDADGSNMRLLTKPGYEGHWSPDDKHIIYQRQKGNFPALYEIDADGTNEHLLVEEVETYYWLPDSASIIFNKFRVYGQPENEDKKIFRMKLDGSDPDVIGTGNNGQPSPDGKRIASVNLGQGTWILSVSNIDGSNLQEVDRVQQQAISMFHWSPDSRHIVFTRQTVKAPTGSPPTIDSDYQIVVVDAETGEARQLTTDGINQSPIWSPDGTQIAVMKFVRDGALRGDLYIMNADGSNPHRVQEIDDNGDKIQWKPLIDNTK